MKDEVEKLRKQIIEILTGRHLAPSVKHLPEAQKSVEDTADLILTPFKQAQVEAVRAARIDEIERAGPALTKGKAVSWYFENRHKLLLANLTKEDTSTTTVTMPLPEIPFKEDGETK